MAPISKKRAILGMSEDYTSFASNSCDSDSNSNMGYSTENSFTLEGHQYARVNRVILDKNSDEYRKRRERNNLAVKKSRTKSKLKSIQTVERVNLLKAENEHLQQKVDILSKELRLLKEIFVAHASSAHGTEITELDLKLLTCSDGLDSPAASPRCHEVPVTSSGHHHFNHHHHSSGSHRYQPQFLHHDHYGRFRDGLDDEF